MTPSPPKTAAQNMAILIPAAGLSSRMGRRDKLLERVGTAPLLARQVGRALATGARVYVTLRPKAQARRAALAALLQDRLSLVSVTDAAEGMAASLRAGVAALPSHTNAVMILLPDMPDLTTSDLTLMIAAHNAAPEQPLQATDDTGTPGHPVVFPSRLFPRFSALAGDQGAKPLLATEAPQYLALPGRHAVTDLDTPEDWHIWRDESQS